MVNLPLCHFGGMVQAAQCTEARCWPWVALFVSPATGGARQGDLGRHLGLRSRPCPSLTGHLRRARPRPGARSGGPSVRRASPRRRLQNMALMARTGRAAPRRGRRYGAGGVSGSCPPPAGAWRQESSRWLKAALLWVFWGVNLW